MGVFVLLFVGSGLSQNSVIDGIFAPVFSCSWVMNTDLDRAAVKLQFFRCPSEFFVSLLRSGYCVLGLILLCSIEHIGFDYGSVDSQSLRNGFVGCGQVVLVGHRSPFKKVIVLQKLQFIITEIICEWHKNWLNDWKLFSVLIKYKTLGNQQAGPRLFHTTVSVS